jgi:hypothetical protein
MARTHVIIDDAELDEIVGPRGRSKFFEEAAREKLDRDGLIKALEATAGIAKGKMYEHWKDAETTAEWVRESRRGKR